MQRGTGLFWPCPRAAGDKPRSLALLLLIHTLFPLLLVEGRGESPPQTTGLAARVKNLYAEENWDEILRLVPSSQDNPPELDYFRGMALAHKERWPEAREAFEAGQRNAPEDKRFPLELAGVAFKQND